MDGQSHDQSFGADAVVIGGEETPCCISASSFGAEYTADPDVRALSEIITELSKQEHHTAIHKPTPSSAVKKAVPSGNETAAGPDKSSSDQNRKSEDTKGTKERTGTARAKKTRRGAFSPVLAVLLPIAVILIGFAVYEIYQMNAIVNSINYVNGGIQFDKSEVLVSMSETQQFVSHTDETKNILLCGTDIDENGISRSDSMIILTIDHKHKKIKMTSLMRDMYLKIPGHGKNKLNAAYTYGGCDLLLKTIYINFGMKIDHYVCVNYGVFASVVDNLGGVEVEVEEMELEQFNKYVGGGQKNKLSEAGVYNLNGKQALSYCRIRKVGSDTARTARQRKVLREIMKKCRKLSPMKAQNILSMAAPDITTNMTRDELTSLLFEGLSSKDYDTLGLRIPMDGAWKDKKTAKGWYIVVELNKNARYLNRFIYGDDETALALADSQQKSDEKRTEHDRSKYEKESKKKES